MWWGNIEYGTTNELVTQKTYKVPAGSLVKLYARRVSQTLYLDNNGGSFKWEPTGQTADDYVSNPSYVTGVQFNMPSSALSLYLNGGGGAYEVRVDSGSVNLWPLSDEPFYSISYNLDGGTLTNPRYGYLSAYSTYTLPTPTKSGYTFLGWTGSNGETPQTIVTIPDNTTGDLSYTAHWKEIPLVDLKFTYVDGTWWDNIKYGTTNEQVVGKTYKVPAGSLVKLYGNLGNQPLYLYADSECSIKWGPTGQASSGGWVNNNNSVASVNGVQFVMPSSVLSLSLGGANNGYGYYRYYVNVRSGSVNLWPLSDEPFYSISYDLDGGTINNPRYEYLSAYSSYTLPTPTKDGYTFLGWTGSNGTTPQTTVTIPANTTGDLSYTANWEVTLVDLTFKGVNNPYWGNIKYDTTNEQVTTKTYKVPAGSTVKLYGKAGSLPLYLCNGASGKTSYNGTKAVAYNTAAYYNNDSSIKMTGAQFLMPSSALSLNLSYSSSDDIYSIEVNSGSITLNTLEE